MIRVDNLRDVLADLGYICASTTGEVWSKSFGDKSINISVDFDSERIVYPDGLIIHRETTCNFSAPENFVVLECITRLLSRGYLPQHIELEKPMPGGHTDTGGYCDILVQDNEGKPFLLIECKTTDSTRQTEFSRAWAKMLEYGGQLFNYFNTYRQAQALCLYASDWVEGRCVYYSHIVSMTDNLDYLRDKPELKSYAEVGLKQGGKEEYFAVWQKTYDQDYRTTGIFEEGIAPFSIGGRVLSIEDLREADGVEIQRKYHEYATIMRQHNISGRENAFDKLVNLFLAKVVDEMQNDKALQFYWRGAAQDDYYSLQDRLQKMYSRGMKDFLGEEVTYIDNQQIEDSFHRFRNDPDATKQKVLEYFRQLKFYTNNDFAFLDVHNQTLFRQNAEILKKVVRMLQDLRLRTDKPNQFLGDLFEGFLDQGVKQSEGQFFTPMPIVRFLVSSLPLAQIIGERDSIPRVIDYACGAGHFLNEYAKQIKPIVETLGQDPKHHYAEIYGVEKEYRLSKVAKVSAFMYGQDEIKIIYQDALRPSPNIPDGSCSVLVANPPYSVKGFLDTLSEAERARYQLSNYVSDTSANNSIEVFFIERAKQLLAPGGVAAIILPSSVLSNGNIYSRTRELILQHFDIISIAEFSSGTFGKTGTNTITLFMRKKSDATPAYEHYRNRVGAWFSANYGYDALFDDAHLLEGYCRHQEIELDVYKTLLASAPSEVLWEHELFKAYRTKFGSDARAKKILSKRLTTKYTAEDRSRECETYILTTTREIESEKLYYYLLAKSNPLPVFILKSPTEKNEIKRFLGYEWSSRKGDEGIKYLGAADTGEDEFSSRKGLDSIVTPLFNPLDLDDSSKLNSLVRSYFLGEPLSIPEGLSPHCSSLRLEDMLDFKRSDWDAAFRVSVVSNNGGTEVVDSKYPVRRLSELLLKPEGTLSKIPERSMVNKGKYPVISQERDNLISGYSNVEEAITDLPIIVFGDHTCSIKFVDFPFLRGADGTQLLKVDECILYHKYLYSYLQTIRIENSEKYERHFKYLKNKFIPLPPLSVQQELVDACSLIDAEYESSRMTIEEYRKKIGEVFSQLEIVSNQMGGGKRMLISSLLKYVVAKVDRVSVDRANYVSTDNMLQDKGGVTAYTGSLSSEKSTSYELGDILVSNIRPYLKKIWLADRNGACSNDVLVFRPITVDKVLPKFIYYSLSRDEFFEHTMSGAKGIKMPRGDKNQIMQYSMFIPPRVEQERIVSEIEGYEAVIAKAQAVMDSCASRKANLVQKTLY